MEDQDIAVVFEVPLDFEKTFSEQVAVDQFVVEWALAVQGSDRDGSPLPMKPIPEEFIAEWSIITSSQ
jgi:hypothetical protein